MKFNAFYLLPFAALFLLPACNDDDMEPENEEELITNMTFVLTSGSDVVSLTFSDPDGDGGNAPTITGGTLAANTTYTGVITLSSPDENITEEIEEEDEEHVFLFRATPASLIESVTRNDADENGVGTGLQTTVVTGDAGSGTLRVVLRHEPNKAADLDDFDAVGGETDIEVDFPLTVQ